MASDIRLHARRGIDGAGMVGKMPPPMFYDAAPRRGAADSLRDFSRILCITTSAACFMPCRYRAISPGLARRWADAMRATLSRLRERAPFSFGSSSFLPPFFLFSSSVLDVASSPRHYRTAHAMSLRLPTMHDLRTQPAGYRLTARSRIIIECAIFNEFSDRALRPTPASLLHANFSRMQRAHAARRAAFHLIFHFAAVMPAAIGERRHIQPILAR